MVAYLSDFVHSFSRRFILCQENWFEIWMGNIKFRSWPKCYPAMTQHMLLNEAQSIFCSLCSDVQGRTLKMFKWGWYKHGECWISAVHIFNSKKERFGGWLSMYTCSARHHFWTCSTQMHAVCTHVGTTLHNCFLLFSEFSSWGLIIIYHYLKWCTHTKAEKVSINLDL